MQTKNKKRCILKHNSLQTCFSTTALACKFGLNKNYIQSVDTYVHDLKNKILIAENLELYTNI